MKPFDICTITAANECQAGGYRKQLEWRKREGMLPERTEFLVYADPQGKRVGSGGSTIYVLHKLLERCNGDVDEAFRGKRILILHSGGDSRRLPAYCAVGKVFVPLPSGKLFALFDALLNNLAHLPCLDDGQVIVSSGDVVLNFDPYHVKFSETGVTGVGYPDSPEVASKHGVYVVSPNNPQNPQIVRDFLQKPTFEELKAAHALDLAGRGFIDTGIMNFAIDALERMASFSKLYEKVASGETYLDLYEEIAFAMLGKEKVQGADKLGEIPFFVSLLPYCGFFHVGRSKQLLQNFYVLTHAGVSHDFCNFVRTNLKGSGALLEGAFVYNTYFKGWRTGDEGREGQDFLRVQGPAFIEGCYLEGRLELEGENILTGVPQGAMDIHLKRSICLTVVPIDEGKWVAIIYGLNDEFKRPVEDEACTFLNVRFSEWMEKNGLCANDLWQSTGDAEDARELWTASLFPVSDEPAKAIQAALSLQYGAHPTQREGEAKVEPESLSLQQPAKPIQLWEASHRISLKDILQATDHERLMERYSWLGKKTNLTAITTVLSRESNLASREIISWCQDAEDYVRLAKDVMLMVEQSDDLLFQARLFKVLSLLAGDAEDKGINLQDGLGIALDLASLEGEAFALVREAIRKGLRWDELPVDNEKGLRIRSDEVVWVCAPARIDLAGGWSDTPPYCLEYGGTVLNVAIKLNGQYPIQAIGKIYRERAIRVNSIDLAQSAIIREMSDMLSFSDPSDWLSLPKAAFVAAGIIPQDADCELSELLKQFGGGIDLTVFSAVPSGSGLGTSSILGSAIIACLARMFGLEFTKDELFNRTLYMEQLMTTGGGWQDQIGGVVGGVKLIQTKPGLFQSPILSWTDLSQPGTNLSDNFLLYYTGYTRMAKNILQCIVGRYLEKDPVALKLVERNRTLAFEMKETLDHRDIKGFGEKISQVWETQKGLDPGVSDERIEGILDKLSPHIHAAKLAGAGGGGFMFIVTRGATESQKVKQLLTESPPNERARFFDFDVDAEGLRVAVL